MLEHMKYPTTTDMNYPIPCHYTSSLHRFCMVPILFIKILLLCTIKKLNPNKIALLNLRVLKIGSS
jgi:hypothetical protein